VGTLYDAQGDRLEKDVWTLQNGLTTIRFAYDNGNIWADLDGTNALQMRRIYLDNVDSVFARFSAGGTAAWYLPDHLGSIRDIADNNTGASIDHIDYDAFGKATESQSSNSDRYKWTGANSTMRSGSSSTEHDISTRRWAGG